MPVLSHHRRHRGIRRTESQQCGQLVDRRVDRSLVAKSAGPRSGHDRAPPNFYRGRSKGTERLSDELEGSNQPPKEDRGRHEITSSRKGIGLVKTRFWTIAFLLTAFALASGCQKHADSFFFFKQKTAYEIE